MTPRRWIPFWRRPAASPPGGLACRELVELVTEYLEDGLGAADRARFEAHIAACEHCSAYLEQMRLTLTVVGHIEPEALDPHVEQELLDAFRDWKAGGG
ncbi:MAG: anti-sigma factor [Conexibacter sp.]|jgi:anti-sigma factor RsiW|nr:anti-sigma factor [Conexibacter sp.]